MIFFVSHWTTNVLEDLLQTPKHKKTVVINGTNPALFYPKNTNQLKQQYQYDRKFIISIITRLVERQAVDTVLKAIPYLTKNIPNLLYLTVGEGKFKPQLLRLVTQLGIEKYVKFVGKIPYEQVSDYYNLSIYVMPSKLQLPEVEAFGIVYLAANTCGKPAIGSKTGDIADAIIDGKTGLLIKEQNPKALADATLNLSNNKDLGLTMGKNGRLRVKGRTRN